MNQARDRSFQPLPDVINEDLMNGPQKRDGLGSNHFVHVHVDPILCNSVGPSSFCKTHSNLSDSHNVQIDSDLAKASVVSDYESPDSSLKASGSTGCSDSAYEDSEETRPGLAKAAVVSHSESPDSSLKASGSLKGSTGCSDSAYEDSEEARPGFFDYMPSHSEHVKIAHTFNPAYDEEVKLASSVGSWTVLSSGNENLTTHDELNLTETSQPHIKHKHICWDYTSVGKHSEDEDMEDEEDERERRGASSNSSSFLPFLSRTPQTEVDECVSYNLKPLKSSSTEQSHQRNTPMLYSLYQDQDQYISEASKDKDKKFKSKDDSDKPEVSEQVDVNGNPRSLDPTSYLQMRQWPRSKSETTASASLSSYTPITLPHSHAASSGSDSNTIDRKKERRRMKLERLKGTPAEEYEGHRKFSDIKEILAFVEGSKTSSKGDNKSGRKKQERSRKKDHLHGPLSLEDTAAGEDVANKEESVVVTYNLRPALKAMGNNFRRPVGENSISKTWSEDDDVDKSSEYHDCLNTFPAELISEADLAKRENLLKLADRADICKTTPSLTEADKSDSSSTGESITEKHLIDSNRIVIKKSTKTKSKKDKQEATRNNGPLSPKSKMLNPKGRLEIKDSVLVTSATNGSIKVLGAKDKELVLDVKREDSFTEVKKRKKRPVGKDLNTALTNHAFSLSYHSLINNGYPHHNRSRTYTPPPALVISSVAVVSSSSSMPVNNQTHSSRDLSPSAFPVLSGQDPPVNFHTDARRNSCGDLSSDSADNKTYDSDRESAKSLPSAHGAKIGGDISPVYPLSYARIAAALTKNDITNSPSSESGIGSLSLNISVNSSITNNQDNSTDSALPQSPNNPAVTPERKATVWKGSPRERRHSVGSSPEDKVGDEKYSVAERNRQSGSQEVIRSVVALVSASCDAVTSSVPVKQIYISEHSISFPINTDLQKMSTPVAKLISNHHRLKSISSAQEVTKSMSHNVGQKIKTTLVASAEYSATSISSNTHAGPSSATFQSNMSSQANYPSVTNVSSEAPEKEVKELNIRKDKQETSADSFMTVSTQRQHTCATDSSSKAVFIKNKLTSGPDAARKSNKSVIFLDKRFASSVAQNLGITFGFDSSCESKSESASQQPQTFPSHSESLPVEPSSLSQSSSIDASALPSCQQQLPHPAVSQEHTHIPSAAQTATTLPDVHLPTNAVSKSSDDTNSHVPKGLHILGPSNGLILPSIPAGNGSIPQYQVASCSIISNTTSNISSISASNDSSNPYLTTSGRTNQSELKTGNVNPNVSCLVNEPGLSSLPPVALENSVLGQVNTSIPHRVIEDTVAIITHTNVMVVTSSPSYQPPSLSQTEATKDRNNKTSSTLSLPSTQGKKESTPEFQGTSGLTESIHMESASKTPSSVKEETKSTLETPVTTTITAPPQAKVAESQLLLVSHEMLPLAKSVVYGLMIKPGVGCGKLLFVPSNVSKNRGHSAEISSFLRKKWLQDVIQKKGSESFVILAED